MSAEVFTLPGVTREESAEPGPTFADTLRRMADQIEAGSIPDIEGALILGITGQNTIVARYGPLTLIEGLGLLEVAKRVMV